MGGVAVAGRQPHHPQRQQREQVRVREIRRRRGEHHDPHRRQLLRIFHARQRQQIGGLLAGERELGLGEFGQHPHLARASGNVFSQQGERAHGRVDRPAIFQPRRVREHELLQHLDLFQRLLGPHEQRLGELLGLLEASAQIHRLDAADGELVAQARIGAGVGQFEAAREMR